MAIKGKTILLGPAYCKQAERKVERVRDAVWRGAENEKKEKKKKQWRVKQEEGRRTEEATLPIFCLPFTGNGIVSIKPNISKNVWQEYVIFLTICQFTIHFFHCLHFPPYQHLPHLPLTTHEFHLLTKKTIMNGWKYPCQHKTNQKMLDKMCHQLEGVLTQHSQSIQTPEISYFTEIKIPLITTT